MEKRKIGIVTFHRALNFGAMLQAFALQQTLSEKHDAKLLDYRCAAIEGSYYPQGGVRGSVKFGLKWILRHKRTKHAYLKRKNFINFSDKYLETTDISYTKDNVAEANRSFDTFICGSDQVWNPGITGEDYNYFLEFADAGKKFSYAGSFGNIGDILSHPRKEKIKRLLSDFRIPLIREDDGFQVLNCLKVENAERAQKVCDPVFLLSREEWIEKLGLKPVDGKYILVYFVAKQTNALEIAKKMAERLQMDVRYLDAAGRYEDCPDWCINEMDAGPKRFLELLLGAEYVLTTSFHGMAFSTILNKQFYYELDKGTGNRNSRLETIAEVFGLQEREITSENMPDYETAIDYQVVNEKLAKYSGESKKLLFQSLESIN